MLTGIHSGPRTGHTSERGTDGESGWVPELLATVAPMDDERAEDWDWQTETKCSVCGAPWTRI
jgi:hypothetical protein